MKRYQDSTDLEPATMEQIDRYQAIADSLRTRRQNRGGIIGLTERERGWAVTWPKCLDIPWEEYKNPVQACARYNQVILKLLGKDAILCEPRAAVKLKNFPQVKRGRPPRTT